MRIFFRLLYTAVDSLSYSILQTTTARTRISSRVEFAHLWSGDGCVDLVILACQQPNDDHQRDIDYLNRARGT